MEILGRLSVEVGEEDVFRGRYYWFLSYRV